MLPLFLPQGLATSSTHLPKTEPGNHPQPHPTPALTPSCLIYHLGVLGDLSPLFCSPGPWLEFICHLFPDLFQRPSVWVPVSRAASQICPLPCFHGGLPTKPTDRARCKPSAVPQAQQIQSRPLGLAHENFNAQAAGSPPTPSPMSSMSLTVCHLIAHKHLHSAGPSQPS